eukprot:g6441.t1
MDGMPPAVFCGDAWRIFDWEPSYEALPMDCSDSCVDYNVILNDDAFWNGSEMLTTFDTAIQSPQNNNIFFQPFSASELDFSFAHIRREKRMLTNTASKECVENSSRAKDYLSTNVLSMFPYQDSPLSHGHHNATMKFLEDSREQQMVLLQSSRDGLQSPLGVKCEPLAATGLIYPQGHGLKKEMSQAVFEPRAKKMKTNATSQYKGVTKHRQTGKFEAHLWDATVIRKGKERRGRKRGKQIYLGGFNNELAAARTYDMAAICFWGDAALTNFPLQDYAADREFLKSTDKHSIVQILRRSAGGYRNGSMIFCGLTLGGFLDK